MPDTPKPKFVPGDLVVLASGGPVMTVISQSPTGFVCGYFGADENYRSVDLPGVALDLDDAEYEDEEYSDEDEDEGEDDEDEDEDDDQGS